MLRPPKDKGAWKYKTSLQLLSLGVQNLTGHFAKWENIKNNKSDRNYQKKLWVTGQDPKGNTNLGWGIR